MLELVQSVNFSWETILLIIVVNLCITTSAKENVNNVIKKNSINMHA